MRLLFPKITGTNNNNTYNCRIIKIKQYIFNQSILHQCIRVRTTLKLHP